MTNIKKLTLLHSNDLHGDFLAENVNSSLVGGVSMLSGYIGKVRSEEDNILYAIAGDMFRGSVIDSEFLGLSTIEIMNMLAPDVVTIGNHETDYGLAHLLFIEKMAKFPIINANLHIKTNNARLFDPYKIIEIDGMRILFIGILTEQVLSQTKKDGLIGTFIDIEDAAKEVGRICNAYNALDIDLTVLLTHIGYEEDKELARRLDPAWGVDIIVGGHSHTLLEKEAVVNDVIIVQAGIGTDQIGRFDLEIDTDNNCISSYKWETIPIDESHCPKDDAITNLIYHFKDQTDAKYQRVITRFDDKMTHPSRTQETTLGDCLADALKENLGLDIMLLGSGSIRTQQMGPIVMLQDLMETFPYDGAVYCLKLSGKQIKDAIKYMCRDEVWQGAHCEFYQLSKGLHVVYSKSKHDFECFEFEGQPIDEERIFTVGLQHYHYLNVDNLGMDFEEVRQTASPKVVSTSDRGVIEEYLSNHQHLWYEVEGRLVVKD